MKYFIKMLIWIIVIVASLYILSMGLLYKYQEKMLFIPDVLPADYSYRFDMPSQEKYIEVAENVKLNALLFKADSSKGVIFYLHGNAGALNSWGFVANIYLEMDYDIFMFDYRGYGKSNGKILSENQFYDDAQIAYNMVKNEYSEDKIIIIGQSLGTATAAMLAAKNNPKKLILISPYFSVEDLVKQKYRIIPGFLLKYKFPTNEFIKNVKAPIVLIHGLNDKLIKPEASIRLKALCKKSDDLILIENLGHNGIHDNNQVQNKLKELLAN